MIAAMESVEGVVGRSRALGGRALRRVTRRADGRAPLWIELAIIAWLFWLYDVVNDLAPLRGLLAITNARGLLSVERSLSLDPELMTRADIMEYEQVTVHDIDNGARFETYAIVGGAGEVCLNGAAARLVQRGDKVIVITYADYEVSELVGFEPTVVHVDAANAVVDLTLERLDDELRPAVAG